MAGAGNFHLARRVLGRRLGRSRALRAAPEPEHRLFADIRLGSSNLLVDLGRGGRRALASTASPSVTASSDASDSSRRRAHRLGRRPPRCGVMVQPTHRRRRRWAAAPRPAPPATAERDEAARARATGSPPASTSRAPRSARSTSPGPMTAQTTARRPRPPRHPIRVPLRLPHGRSAPRRGSDSTSSCRLICGAWARSRGCDGRLGFGSQTSIRRGGSAAGSASATGSRSIASATRTTAPRRPLAEAPVPHRARASPTPARAPALVRVLARARAPIQRRVRVPARAQARVRARTRLRAPVPARRGWVPARARWPVGRLGFSFVARAPASRRPARASRTGSGSGSASSTGSGSARASARARASSRARAAEHGFRLGFDHGFGRLRASASRASQALRARSELRRLRCSPSSGYVRLRAIPAQRFRRGLRDRHGLRGGELSRERPVGRFGLGRRLVALVIAPRPPSPPRARRAARLGSDPRHEPARPRTRR